LKYGVEDIDTAVEAEIVPPRMVTPRPPDVVTGATPSDVPTMLTSAPPRIVTPRPPEVVTGATPEDVPTMLIWWVPEIWIAPEDAETMGMLKPGAHDHGLVAAVAVTVWTDDSEMIPDEALTNGMLKLGAEDHGLVAAVAVTVGTLESVIRPDDRLARRPAEVVTGATAVEAAAPTTRT
jgi:hypothetical protein